MPKVVKGGLTNAVYHFSFRWSLPVEQRSDASAVAKFRERHAELRGLCARYFDKYVFQLERTDGDNFHYQGYGHARERRRCSAIGRLFTGGLGSGVHFQAASTAGKESLQSYAMKEDTRVAGPWADCKKYLGQDLPSRETLRPWQAALLAVLEQPPDDRTIMWVVDEVGGAGKTKFAKYLAYRHKVPFGAYAKSADMLNLVSKHQGATAYVFDLTRCKPQEYGSNDLYATLESIKNGMFCNTKYTTEQVLMDPPHVLVFSNHPPDLSKLSRDRWRVWGIEDGQLTGRSGRPPLMCSGVSSV